MVIDCRSNWYLNSEIVVKMLVLHTYLDSWNPRYGTGCRRGNPGLLMITNITTAVQPGQRCRSYLFPIQYQHIRQIFAMQPRNIRQIHFLVWNSISRSTVQMWTYTSSKKLQNVVPVLFWRVTRHIRNTKCLFCQSKAPMWTLTYWHVENS